MSPLADACLYRGAAPVPCSLRRVARQRAAAARRPAAARAAPSGAAGCRGVGLTLGACLGARCAARYARARRLSRLLVLAPRHCLRLVVVGQLRLGRAAPCCTAQRIPRPSSLLLHDSPLSLALLHVSALALHLRTAFDRPSPSLQLTLHTCRRRRRRSRLASLLATHTFPGPTHNTHSQLLCIRALTLSLASRACLAASSLTRPTACSERALYFCSLSLLVRE